MRTVRGGSWQETFYITLPCFDWVNERRALSGIFYEHVNCSRMIDFFTMFGAVCAIGCLFGGRYPEGKSVRNMNPNYFDEISQTTNIRFQLVAINCHLPKA